MIKTFKRGFLLLSISAIILLLANCAKTKSTEATLSGKLNGFSNAPIIQPINALSPFILPDDGITVEPDKDGNFSLKLSLTEPTYYRLGRNTLYLSPGDKLQVELDYEDPRISTFKGDGSEANDYLKNTPFPKAGSFLDGGENIKKSLKATVDNVLNLAKKREEDLLSRKKLSKDFIKLEQARIKADIVNSLNSTMLLTYFSYMNQIPATDSSKIMAEYMSLCPPIIDSNLKGLVNGKYLNVDVYQDIVFMVEQANQNLKDGEMKQISNWLDAIDTYNEMEQMNEKSALKSYDTSKFRTLENPYQEALKRVYGSLTRIGNGSNAINFTANDEKGKAQNLEQFKGKVIFIDMWATWCGPCLQEMPHFEKLKDVYKNNPDIVFISLSIDEQTDAWKQNLKERKATGLQWNTARKNLKDYSVKGVPRVVIIGKDFKIANMNAPMPSDEKTKTILNEMLKK